MEKNVETVVRSLCSRHIKGVFAQDSDDAKSKILASVSTDAVVGIGDSTTVRQIGVVEELRKKGTRVLDGFDPKTEYGSIKDWEHRNRLLKESMFCDVFLTGTNAITEEGRLVNVDGVGNRVAGMVYGHPTTIIVVGRNKIVKNLDEAFHRLRKVIAPNHIRIRALELGGWCPKTPCVATGECNDCRVEDRACNIFTIIESKPLRTDMMVIIVDRDLGLGWDESWQRERINSIVENYKKYVWVPPADVFSKEKWVR